MPMPEESARPEEATAATSERERLLVASQWQLIWWKFRRHKPAIVSGVVILLLYLIGAFCEFLAPDDPFRYNADYTFAPPQRVRFFDGGRFSMRPFVYGLAMSRDPYTLRARYVPDTAARYPLHFFVHGARYKLWGLFGADLHLVGIEDPRGTMYLLGSDRNGRDLLSRVVYGTRISMSIGLVGVALSLILGILIGGVSGYYGGAIDDVIQRVIEFLRSVPSIPLWMALSAALPPHWSALKVYFGITVILSLISWTWLARVVRGRFLAMREEDFIMAANIAGASELAIIARHMVPSFLSHIIASITLSIPDMILSETALSFLGLGLRPPIVSWGVLLQEAQNVRTVVVAPWLFIPGLFVVIAVLAFNFLGDGLRDAADPYTR